MDRAVKPGEAWSTFIFDGIDCAELGVYAVTSGSTYTTNIEPTFNDNFLTVSAYDGQYYYGTQITGQQFTFTMFAENLTYNELTKLRTWLHPRHIGKLILSTQPFKYYYVKPVSIGELGNIPLGVVQTPIYTTMGVILDGDPVYTGTFTLVFQTVGSAFAYGLSYLRDDLIYDAKANGYPDDYYYDSGLLYKDEMPSMKWNVPANADMYPIPVYNPGDAVTFPIFKVNLGTNTLSKGDVLTFINKTLGDVCHIDLQGLSGEITIDFTKQMVKRQSDGQLYYGRLKGNPIKLSERKTMVRLPASVIEDEIETQSFTVENNVVTIRQDVLKPREEWAGRCMFCVSQSGGALITDVDGQTLTLSSSGNTTPDIPSTGIEFNYKENNLYTAAQLNANVPEGEEGWVMKATDSSDWFMYCAGWKKTSMFYSKQQFLDDENDLQPITMFMSAVILDLDDLVISTNIGAIEVKAEVLPRYI